MPASVLTYITESKIAGDKLLAVLLDPDKVNLAYLSPLLSFMEGKADFIFVGGSTVANEDTQKLVTELKKLSKIPVVLFPGDYTQITDHADAILFLSLLSGENPEYLIKQQLKSIPKLKETSLEVIPTGYILIDGDKETSVQKVSNTHPIESTNIDLAVNTAIAGMYMGKQLMYLEAGSGAKNPVPLEMIKAVSNSITIPLIVGGGIRTKTQLQNAYANGADLVVIGTAFEENNSLFDNF